MPKTIIADRGLSMRLDDRIEHADKNPTWVAASRLGRLRAALPAYTVWLQMRGSCQISSVEGSFLLQRGEWIAFSRASQPQLQSDHRGLTLGLVLPVLDEEHPMPVYLYPVPLVGRGHMPRHELKLALRIWRHNAHKAPSETSAARPFLLNVSHAQHELARQFSRAPGRSFRRKVETFEALQRMKLYLDGNSHRVVRNTELAALSGWSTWYLSKTFNSVYGAGPQTIAFNYRLERARKLLTTTSLAIGEVGDACGFSQSATFARAFLSGHGMTASTYRKTATFAEAERLPLTREEQSAAHS